MSEYTGARTLATVEHCGIIFRVVRKRVNGKPWRKYVTLLHDDDDMAGTTEVKETDPVKAAAIFKSYLDKVFGDGEKSKQALLDRIAYVRNLHRENNHDA
jgi:hypothetical protein